MELLLYLAICVWLVVMDMRGFSGNKQWPFRERVRVKRPDEV
jgi:hypothetical protein